ncbi:MAG TPA: hypothetical protein DER70_10325 [Lentisphaeria bacterium]|nr:hypothetical protein [Lentisphaeria bacterium]
MYFIRISPFWNNLPEKNIFSIQIQLFFQKHGKHPEDPLFFVSGCSGGNTSRKEFSGIAKKVFRCILYAP